MKKNVALLQGQKVNEGPGHFAGTFCFLNFFSKVGMRGDLKFPLLNPVNLFIFLCMDKVARI